MSKKAMNPSCHSELKGDRCKFCKKPREKVGAERVKIYEQKTSLASPQGKMSGMGVFWEVKCGGCGKVQTILFSFDPG